MPSTICFSVSLEEHYLAIESIQDQPVKQKIVTEEILALSLKVTVEELYQIQERVEIQEVQEEVQEEVQILELSTERSRLSRRCLSMGGLGISDSLSVKKRICKMCRSNLKADKVWVTRSFETQRVQDILIPASGPWLLCLYCVIEQEKDLMFLRYQRWCEKQYDPTQVKIPLKRSQKDRLPGLEPWMKAYKEDMKTGTHTSLPQLERDLDQYKRE